MNHAGTSAVAHVSMFCGSCSCGRPELYQLLAPVG